MLFYRADHTNLVIRLDSNEPLGILDTDYIEDYNGDDGQLTIYNVDTITDTPLSMVPLPFETPGIPNDVFQGSILLSSLPDNDYQIRGRVRDVIGNYTILSAFGSPNGNERVMMFEFSIVGGEFIPSALRMRIVPVIERGAMVDEFIRIETIENLTRSLVVQENTRSRTISDNNRVHLL